MGIEGLYATSILAIASGLVEPEVGYDLIVFSLKKIHS